jgi:hypothetical protein
MNAAIFTRRDLQKNSTLLSRVKSERESLYGTKLKPRSPPQQEWLDKVWKQTPTPAPPHHAFARQVHFQVSNWIESLPRLGLSKEEIIEVLTKDPVKLLAQLTELRDMADPDMGGEAEDRPDSLHERGMRTKAKFCGRLGRNAEEVETHTIRRILILDTRQQEPRVLIKAHDCAFFRRMS